MQTELTTAQESAATQSANRFQLGQVLLTPGAIESLSESGQMPHEFLSRHARLEQDELTAEDYKENLYSVDKRLRVFSAFKTARGMKLWVITEADRSATTILLPSEY